MSSEDAGQILYIPLVGLGGNVSSNLYSLYELASGGGILAFIDLKQGQIDGPLEAVVCSEVILKVY